MSIPAFAIVATIIAVVIVAAIREIPNIPSPLNWLLPVLILLADAAIIAVYAGII